MSFNSDYLGSIPYTTTPLVYPTIIEGSVDQYINVLLIDSQVKNYQTFVDSVNSSTFPIVYSMMSSKTELLTLLQKMFTNINRIGIAFSSSLGDTTYFLDHKPLFVNDEIVPYCENLQFVVDVVKGFKVKNIDYLACDTLNYLNWKKYYELLAQDTEVIVGASNNKTGNIKYGGDWLMESTNQDIELIYFTKSIEYYSYLLDNPPNIQTYKIIWDNDPTIYGLLTLDTANAPTFSSGYLELIPSFPTWLREFTLNFKGTSYAWNTFTKFVISNQPTYTSIFNLSQFNTFTFWNNTFTSFNWNEFRVQTNLSERYIITNVELYTLLPPPPIISNICFVGSTPITTNQGNIPINKINPQIHTIRNKKIVRITQTTTQDKYLVCFEKDSLAPNIPSQKTIISSFHCIYYQGKMMQARDFVGKYENVKNIRYRGETLYNVLMDDHEKMLVNNLICETLNPKNTIVKVYNILEKLNPKKQESFIKQHNKYVINNKIF